MARLISQMTYNQIGAALVKGQLLEKELRSYYTSMRRTAMSRVRSIEKSGLPFSGGEKPYFQSARNLVTTQQMIAAVADLNRFINRKASTVTGRKIVMEHQIERLQERGIDVDESNYLKWIEFIQWFQASEYAAKYDSDSEEVGEVFEQGSNAQEWGALFAEWSGS